jgi:ubiquinone/menaquinone biosynthesis C-methylase UbiE
MSAQTLEEHRRSIREIADAVAPGWERHRAYIEATTTPVREWMLRELAPQPGQTVLELAAGAGDTGFDAAVLTGERGRLICSDISPAMLDVARRRGAARGVLDVDYRLLDMEAIALGDDCVDGILCRYAYMIVADPAAALAETRRVLRPGGRVALAVWGAPDRNPFFSVLGMTLVRGGHVPPPDPSMPGPFSLGDPERVCRLLADAGFAEVRTEEVGVRFRFREAEDCVALAADTSGPMALVLQGLSDAERAKIAESVGAAFAAFRSGAGYEVPGVTVVAAAVA